MKTRDDMKNKIIEEVKKTPWEEKVKLANESPNQAYKRSMQELEDLTNPEEAVRKQEEKELLRGATAQKLGEELIDQLTILNKEINGDKETFKKQHALCCKLAKNILPFLPIINFHQRGLKTFIRELARMHTHPIETKE